MIFCTLCISFASKAQQYNFKTYTVKDGLGHSQVSQIIQDKDGYMWFTLFGGGFAKFDGKTFTNYSEKDGACSNLTRPIIKDHNGLLWIGALGGDVCTYDNKTFRSFKPKGDSLNQKVYTILQDDEKNYWFGSDIGVYKYDGKTLYHLGTKEGLAQVPIMHIFQDSKKRIWVAAWEQGVYCYENKQWKQYTIKDGLTYHTQMCLTEDHEGTIWVSSFKGVTKIKTNKAGELSFSRLNHPLLDSTLVFESLDDGRENMYFATSEKALIVYNYKNNSFENITVKNGLPGNVVYNVKKDSENNLWISCWGYGITKYSGKRFMHYTTKEGLKSNFVSVLSQDHSGSMIVGTGSGLNSLKNNVVSDYLPQLPNEAIHAIVSDNDNGFWISTMKAVYHQQNGSLKKYTYKDGIKAFPATALAYDKNGVLWMGSWAGGLTSYDGKEFKNYSVSNGLGSDFIYSIYPAVNGDTWICTWDGGLTKISANGKFSRYKKAEGLPGNHVISALNDKEGNLWVAVYGGGIARYDGKTFSVISTADGLIDDACNGLVFDKDENLWISTSKGLDKLNTKAYNSSKQILIKHYGAEEGFAALECQRNAMFKDTEGNLWFGTKTGLTKYTPSEDRTNDKAPYTCITDLKLFFEKSDFTFYADSINWQTQLPVNLKLPYDQNHLTFNFIGISLTNPEKVRYSYILEGADSKWSPLTTKTEITYSSLQPGKYCFMVRSGVLYNNMDERNMTRFYFEVLPPWYKTWWAYAMYVITGIALFFSTVFLRTKKLKKEKEILESVVKERTFEIVQQKHLVEEKNKEITDSIHYAKRIQKALLTSESYIKKHVPEFFILYKPKDIVSGDFYWAINHDSKFIIVTADCTGHGVPGAFMSMLGINYLTELIAEKNITAPDKIFNELRKNIINVLNPEDSEQEAKDGMDAVICSFDFETNILEFAAANNPLWLIRNNELTEFKANKMPVGKHINDSVSFTLQTIELQKGDQIYTFTDGYTDQFGGPKGKKFKHKQFEAILLENCHLPLKEQQIVLNAAIEEWKGSMEQVDDILVIGLRV